MLECAYTFAISAALVPSYGYAIHHAANLYSYAGVHLTEVSENADITFLPMPPKAYPADWAGMAKTGEVFLRVRMPGFKPRLLDNVRVNVVIHEIQHEMGWTHADIRHGFYEDPTVPALGCKVM